MAQTQPIMLRLGDTLFVTCAESLSAAGGMLAAMFAHDMRPGDTDATGAIHIQRDPMFFSYVMQYVQGGPVQLEMLSISGLEQLAVECDYYQLPALAKTVKDEIASQKSIGELQERELQEARTESGELRRALRVYAGKYKDPGCLVVRSTARKGERVANRISPSAYGAVKRKGTITSVTENNGTEVGVMWDNGRYKLHTAGWSKASKKTTYQLEYAS